MNNVRAALIIATGERYVSLMINFATVAIVSRLMTPTEIGVSVVGVAIVGFALALREYASPTYLIQHTSLSHSDTRRAFTLMLGLNTAIALVLSGSAPGLANAFNDVRLIPYLQVIAVSIVVELIAATALSLFRRHLLFGKVALINLTTALVTALATISMALAGFGYMSFAWAWLAGALCSSGLALLLLHDRRIFRPLLGGLSSVLSFGVFNGTNILLYRIYEAMPYLILGRIVSLDAAAFFSRAQMICQLPDKTVLVGAVSVILPAFSAKVREGTSLRTAYLHAVSLISALQWPALLMIILFAHPLVMLLFGHQWIEIVPIVRVLALASLFSFSFELNYPVLVAVGAVRDALLRALVIWPVSGLILTLGAFFGLKVAAASMLLAIPFQAAVSFAFVKRHVDLTWAALANALWKSGIATIGAAVGPMSMIAVSGFSLDVPVATAFVAVPLAAVGWLAAVILTKHPALLELRQMALSCKRLLHFGRRGAPRVPVSDAAL